jgi:hypothetical protein
MRMRADLGVMAYSSEEFAISGEARSFEPCARGEASGATARTADVAPYCTRVVVFRPSDPARFRGTAVVEWLNCRDGTDIIPQWLRMHRHIVRSGMAWIGVSTHRIGVEGVPGGEGSTHLKAADPVRYAGLAHPGDAFCYDMFRQAALLLRCGALSLPPPACVLGTGSSQSARYLTTFINAVGPACEAFDGFLLTGRHRSAATLDGASICGGEVPVRDDTRAPVIVLQPETDIFGRMQSVDVRQADTARFRLWEVAGAAHADSYTVKVGKIDDGTVGAAALAAAYAAVPNERMPLSAPMNASPAFHYVHHAALEHLEAWARAGVPPPSAPLLAGDRATGIVRDHWGVAVGGVRTPWVDCPAQVHSGVNGERCEFAALFGRTLPLPPGALARLYPGGGADYLGQFAAALGRSIAAGFLLEADAPEILRLAQAQFAALTGTAG